MDSCRRKGCLSLQILCEIQIVKTLQQKAANLEASYMDKWSYNGLTVEMKNYERKLCIRDPDVVDTAKVVKEFSSKYPWYSGTPEAQPNKGPKCRAARMPAGQRNRRVLKPAQKPKIKNGIPVGVNPQEYVLFRKCKYIEDIKAVRRVLEDNLNKATLNGLMFTMFNLSQYNSKQEHGLLTLQAMLSTNLVSFYRVASPKLHLAFSRDPTMGTSLGGTILHFSLIAGQNLVHLNLERCCCDSILKLVSQVSRNLRILQISSSPVSDTGLLYLCGVEKKAPVTRERFSRACKEVRYRKTATVEDRIQKFNPVGDGNTGCLNLEHLEADNLLSIDWPAVPSLNPCSNYKNCQSVPLDSGFVTILNKLPKMRVLLTEMTGRIVLSYLRMHRKNKNRQPTLGLEIISESHLTPSLMSTLESVCPKLVELRVNWCDMFTPEASHREDWLGLMSLMKLKALRTREIEFSTDKLSKSLATCGHHLTNLDLREITLFSYSNFRAIKLNCPNLVNLTMAMTTKRNLTTISRIEVDKDANLEVYPDIGHKFSKLKNVHFSGPFGNALIKYMLRGAEAVTNLSLGIQWLDPAFCYTQPDGRRDLIGKDYLMEILSVTELRELEELHLYTKYHRGHTYLTMECAEFILSTFTKLKHLGNFSFWNMQPSELNEIFAKTRSANRDITFDEDLCAPLSPFTAKMNFHCRYIEDREKLSCNDISFKIDEHAGFLSDFFDVLAGPEGLLVHGASDDSDSDEDMWSDDDGDNVFMVHENFEQPPCAIM